MCQASPKIHLQTTPHHLKVMPTSASRLCEAHWCRFVHHRTNASPSVVFLSVSLGSCNSLFGDFPNAEVATLSFASQFFSAEFIFTPRSYHLLCLDLNCLMAKFVELPYIIPHEIAARTNATTFQPSVRFGFQSWRRPRYQLSTILELNWKWSLLSMKISLLLFFNVEG